MTDEFDEMALFDDHGRPAQFPTVSPKLNARNTDPAASHDAAHQLTTGASHCLALLRHFGSATDSTDEAACRATGLERHVVGKRSADLRRLGFIEWLRDEHGEIVRRMGDSGRRIGVSRITDQGRIELRNHQGVTA